MFAPDMLTNSLVRVRELGESWWTPRQRPAEKTNQPGYYKTVEAVWPQYFRYASFLKKRYAILLRPISFPQTLALPFGVEGMYLSFTRMFDLCDRNAKQFRRTDLPFLHAQETKRQGATSWP
jgi:hypothetical protein